MSRERAEIMFESGDGETFCVEACDFQFAFSMVGRGESDGPTLYLDMDDVDDLVAFLLAMKEG